MSVYEAQIAEFVLRLRCRGSRAVHAAIPVGERLWTACGRVATDQDQVKGPATKVDCRDCLSEAGS